MACSLLTRTAAVTNLRRSEMPGTNEAPADDATGTAAGTAGSEAPQSGTKPPKTFTQEELDAIVEARLKRAVPVDYAELQALKVERDAAAEASKTELQKEKDARAAAEAKGQQAIANANQRLVRAAIIEQAASQGAVDADTVAALLAGSEDITVTDGGDVAGAKKAVADLLKDKPFLVKASTPGASGGEFGGTDPKDKGTKILELEQKANDPKLTAQERQAHYAEARALKLT